MSLQSESISTRIMMSIAVMSWVASRPALLVIAVFVSHVVRLGTCTSSVFVDRIDGVSASAPDHAHNLINEIDGNDLSTIDNDKLDAMSRYLAMILVQPWPDRGLPLLYVEDTTSDTILDSDEDESDNQQLYDLSSRNFKRSRYYRKYPWKRQNSKQAYDAENRYLCEPSRDDVIRLLVALHEARQGSRQGHTINFCNRKRPASAVFTNIRFLGK